MQWDLGKGMQGVHSLWILERQTGICLFEQTFEATASKVDADLIGGFLNAITKFCEELVGEGIQLVETPTKRILYHGEQKFIIAVLADKAVDTTIAEAMLSEISSRFALKYADYLETGQLSNVAVFNDFAAELEHRFESKGTCFIHCFLEKHAKKKEHLENLYGYMKMMVEKRRSSIRCIPCGQGTGSTTT